MCGRERESERSRERRRVERQKLVLTNSGLEVLFRFDARKALEMLRGKRLVLVGDSIGRNQWESIMCLLRRAVSNSTRICQAGGREFTKKRGHYNFRFLVRIICPYISYKRCASVHFLLQKNIRTSDAD